LNNWFNPSVQLELDISPYEGEKLLFFVFYVLNFPPIVGGKHLTIEAGARGLQHL
jgi:hypothetical protein